jgi:hypothetical protein
MLTKRTTLLFLATILLLLIASRQAHRRQALCESRPHAGARHAPIPGASGDPADFGCALIAPATLAEKGIDLSFCLFALAFLRSFAVDIHAARLRRLAAYPPDKATSRPSVRDAFTSKDRPGR